MPSSRMQETTSLWECSSTLERKTLPQTFIYRACFFSPPFFPYLLFISLQLETFARSTQSAEKRLVGRAVSLQEVIARSQTKRKNLACADLCSLQGGSNTEGVSIGAARASNFKLLARLRVLLGSEPWIPQAILHKGKGHFCNFYLICLVGF